MARSFFRSLVVARQEAEQVQNSEVLSVIDWVEKWMKTTPFSTYKKKNIITDNYELSNRELSFQLGITEKSAKEVRLALSRELFQIFGSDFFQVLTSGTEEGRKETQRRINFAVSSFGVESIRKDVIIALKKSNVAEFPANIESCESEVDFLKRNTVSSLESELSELNIGKLKYLVSLLEGNSRNYKDKVELTQTLGGIR